MPVASGFRIQKVAIEGFKGFTIRQEIDLDGCHAFLLGQNGNGKSSIVEAIRWGLFGSTRRPNEIVANRDYSDRCRVEITLIREEKVWHLRRTLIRGSSGGSDAELTDDQGEEHPIRNIMPQLDSAEAGEGMHIIFASQSTPLRRQPEDLRPFERTVFNHLGLTHPQALLSQLDDFLETQESEETNLAGKLTEARQNIDGDISRLEHQRDVIVSSPPWGSSHAPSSVESEKKAREVIEEITGNPPDEAFSGFSLDALIDESEDALEDRRSQDLDKLEKEAEEIVERRERLEKFRDIQAEIKTQQSTVRDKQSELDDTLEDMSLDELQNRVNEKRAAADAEDLRRQIAETASDLIHRDEENSVSCPVCETTHSRKDLDVLLRQIIDKPSGATTSELNQLEAQLKRAENLEREARSLKSDLDKLEQEAHTVMTRIDPDDAKDFTKRIKQCLDREVFIQEQIDGREDRLGEMERRLPKLREEARFHDIRKQLTGIKQSRSRFERVEKAYEDLVVFGESVRSIRRAVEICLKERLENDIPGVSESLSKVFASLTHHPWYDRLTIVEDKLPKLELQVASSHDPSGRGHPTTVLNGQSESALELVPYFAFSQADDAPTEVYLVLLDDPTRAFDEEHTEILVERLAELGNHVQLVVASQETTRFRSLLPKNFQPASYVVVEPNQWRHSDGPQLKIERDEAC